MGNIRVTTVQTDIAWQLPAENLDSFDVALSEPGLSTDIVVLPEMFTTGFPADPRECAESWGGTTREWMEAWSSRLNAVVMGSIPVEADGSFFNRAIIACPDGRFLHYDKRHLFRMGGERQNYSSGSERLEFTWLGWKIRPSICYDLRFPVWTRNDSGYDILVVMANWPEKRRHVWSTLLAARAIENQAYTVGVNRIGSDANGLEYSGDTSVFDFEGVPLYRAMARRETRTTELDRRRLDGFRESFPALLDRDKFSID